jgi:dihydroorotate dehydrogenase electron transfer subunit
MHSVRILARVEHGPELVSLRLPWTGAVLPGQFVFAWLPESGERPFSVSEREAEWIELTIRAVGPHSRGLCALRPGDLLGLRGPFGNPFSGPWSATPPPSRPILVGGGIGAAPIRFLACELRRRGGEPWVLLGARRAGDLSFVEEFAAMGARFATDDGSLGVRGPVTMLLDEALDAARGGPGPRVQACGPEGMLRALGEELRQRSVPFELSHERVMKCGIGLCGHCCVEGSGIRLCVEGPVLEGGAT